MPDSEVLELEAETPEVIRRATLALAALVRDACEGTGIGFCLILFETEQGEGGPGWLTYASNARRDDVIGALEDIAKRMRAFSDRGVPDAS